MIVLVSIAISLIFFTKVNYVLQYFHPNYNKYVFTVKYRFPFN